MVVTMNNQNKISQAVNERIKETIKNKIKPDIKIIFLKLFVVHLSVAIFTLSFCPQLGVSTFNTGFDIAHKLLALSKETCELFCGFFFTSSSIAVSLFFLTRDEIRFLRFNKTFLASTFVLVSIGMLLMFNSQLFVELSILWLVGTLVGVVGTLELGTIFIKKLD